MDGQNDPEAVLSISPMSTAENADKTADAERDSRDKPATGSLVETYRAWRYFFWLLGVILLVVGFYAEENWRGPRAWENYQRARAAKGEILKASAFIPPLVPDGQNFATAPSVPALFNIRSRPFASRFDDATGWMKS